MKFKLIIALGSALFFLEAVAAQYPPAEPRLEGEGTLKVMTYNMYVGTEYAGVTSPDLDIARQASTNMILDVRASDPQGRAQAIAGQIAATKPHLVSLQEVATWSSGTTKDNLTVEFDYLQLLLDALAAQGSQYTPVVSLTTWDATVPSTFGFVRNTWRVVILARSDRKPEDLSFSNAQAAPWSATLVVRLYALDGHPDLCPVALRPSDGSCRMPMPRGWVSTDVSYRDKQFRIIGAHLDSASPLLEVPQGLELIKGPGNTTLPVVIAADLNADCGNSSDPMYPTCDNFKKAGFIDAWEAANPSEPGYTKTLFPLDDPNAVLTQRSDFVMVKGRFNVQAAVLVGEELADRTESGLWPSDHCGVVVRLQLPAPE